MRKHLAPFVQYGVFVGIPAALVAVVLWMGPAGTATHAALPAATPGGGPAVPMPSLSLLLLQILAILVAATVAGRLMQWIGQPRVVGEMIAGIALGPSLLGTLAPGFSSAIFPAASLGFLNSLSQVGLVFFMFLVGLELDHQLLRKRGHTAVLISHASITTPFLLGALLAVPLYPILAPANVGFMPFALFMGAAMSVTAFPVLARILTERRLLQTRVGAVSIVCAAVDDVTAWCILALVVGLAGAGGHGLPLWATLGGTAAYCVLMLWGVRPLLAKLGRSISDDGGMPVHMIAIVAMVVLASAWFTEVLGVHALFGAFVAGVVMPRDPRFVRGIIQRFEDVMVVVLLPLFFAFTGLRTSIGLIDGLNMWLVCGLVIAVAIVGKFGGSAMAARMSGMSWRESGAIGLLMNTRGLMELVILNVGLDIGVISPTLFAMMVIMALVTTFMTTPLLHWVYPTPAALATPPSVASSKSWNIWKTVRR